MDEQRDLGPVLIWAFVLAILMLIIPLRAQAQDMPNFCDKPLDMRADPGQVTDWRMRCTIAKLVAERAEEADKATQIEVDLAVSDAHLKATRAMLDAANKKAEEKAVWWGRYSADPRPTPELAAAIDATCAWKGWYNKPQADLCRLWHQDSR